MNALTGCAVVLDVQHLYRSGSNADDRGTIYTLASGQHVAEADCVVQYVAAARGVLEAAGARVIVNDPRRGLLVGPYSTRQMSAMAMGATVYLACHLNAGGGSYALCEFVSPESAALAEMLASQLGGVPAVKGGRIDRLAPHERGWVCVQGFHSGPAVLVEPLFGDNREHQANLTLAGLKGVGEAVAQGVIAWWPRRGVGPA